MKINNIDIQSEIKVKKEKNYQLCYNFDSDRSVRKRKSNVALINRVMSFLPMVPSQFTSRQLKVKSVFPPVSSSHIGCTFVKQKQASKQASKADLLKKGGERRMRNVVGALNATHPDARSGLMHPPRQRGASASCACTRLTYGMEPSKYILTTFGRILMGGPLSVLCLTASSFFAACCGPHFTRIYRVTQSPVPWWMMSGAMVQFQFRSSFQASLDRFR